MEGSTVVGSVNTIASFIQNGGAFMWVILIVWGFGIAIAIERFIKLSFKFDVDGASFMNELQRYILSNDIQGAIRVCSGSAAALPRVLKSGLKRSTSSPGQIQNAIDATALEVIPKVELRMNYLQLVANIATLFGLLGTIQGLIESFAAVAAADPAQKAELLATGISKAMNTTFLGLLAAISIMMVHTFLQSKSDKIVNEIDEFSVKLMDLLGTKKEKGE
ncbi:transporter, MotA/TolQ/ExbB proton channel family protein [Bacteriovorax sp. BSW11_IV]|uniref:MotA/TolQ/ExbB proton channel family protein n=1 Tax=Bacteriovorax sp. BSW11_IV TaxID=1353529 RepID=UPI00038A310F|nr:MotA/TolQ/ExbB proton channel family protein [Bacteriovorax sp. BSW11_IV]EQC48317.1 transporter, MotA/TolQ/ExbB proton channel family protein [Bacteriovorax sp. BSW11_IV]